MMFKRQPIVLRYMLLCGILLVGVLVAALFFPVPVQGQSDQGTDAGTVATPATIATAAEGDLGSETEGIQAQARQARPLDEGEDLLKASAPPASN